MGLDVSTTRPTDGDATSLVAAGRVRVPTVRGVERRRVDALLDLAWEHRVTLVLAPLGSGKTTALAQFAARAPHPVAWYRADSTDTTPAAVLAHLRRALAVAIDDLPAVPGGADRPERLASTLEAWVGERAALVVDDLHSLRGTAAEAVVGEMIELLPANIVLVAGTRLLPGFDVTRLRVAGDLLEVNGDDLRFRTWEAERLFRDEYRLLLPPEQIARLARRTEGWAAGLQLFQLAARGRAPAEQLRLIDVAGNRARLGREYLARNMLDGLDPELRTFLIDTCVLGVVTPALADRLLDRNDSTSLLTELEHGQLFTVALEDGIALRYHEVLRTHLEALLVERDGEESARRRHQDAAALLEADGFAADALRCYGRGGDWEAVSRLLGQAGADLEGTFRWLDTFPPSVVEGDPWLLLARGRARRDAGELRRALADFAAAEERAGSTALGMECVRERLALAAWLDPRLPPPPGWSGRLRSALQADEDPDSPASDAGLALAEGLAALARGDLNAAAAPLEAVLGLPGATNTIAAAARLALALAGALGGRAEPAALDEAAESAERSGVDWLARVARAAVALTSRPWGIAEASSARARADVDGDPWGAALAALLDGLGRLNVGADAVAVLADAAARFRTLDALVLEALALAARALGLARRGDPAALDSAITASHHARLARSPGAQALAQAALTLVGNGSADEHRRRAEALAASSGLRIGVDPAPPAAVAAADASSEHGTQPGAAPRRVAAVIEPPPAAASTTNSAEPPPPVELRCFGAFRLEVAGQPVNLRAVRPRARSALRFLAIHAGRPVHREQLIDALWPDTPLDTGLRKLQVALSSLRQVMPPASGLAIGRDGESYRLVVPPGGRLDIIEFDASVARARRAAERGDHGAALEAGFEALNAHPDDLLVEEGPAEWVLGPRDQYRAALVATAAIAADAALTSGKPELAATAAERGLAVDRYADGLWRLLERALVAAGDVAAAERARRNYADVREELGLDA